LAATFFAGIGVKANVAAEQSMDKQISTVMTDMSCQVPVNLTNLERTYNLISGINGVKDVDYVANFFGPVGLPSNNYTGMGNYATIASFPRTSKINDEWLNSPGEIPTNYTYVIKGSNLASRVKVGDNITTSLDFPTPKYYNSSSVYVNLTVAGEIELTDKGYSLLTGNTYYSLDSKSPYGNFRSDYLVISWENTVKPLWNSTLDSSTVSLTYYINVDRQALISPWNIETSITNINQIADRVQNEILGNYLNRVYVNNALSGALSGYQNNLSQFLISFVVVSIPIFFVAWYIGSTVSDVSFNIRRREIGLLSTKGLSSGQIQRMFLTEAVVIGLIGGLLGVIGGLILNQYYSGAVNLNSLFTSQLFSPEIAVVTVVFGVVLALFSVFFSSRRASRIPAVEALRNDLPQDKSRRKVFPIVALILGGYKIVMYALGLNINTLISQASFSGGNIFLGIVALPLSIFDTLMTIFGPFLFFWGLTKLVIRDSTKFQTVVSKIASVMGDLGALAAKNVRRNPGRLAAIAFVIALIMGLTVQVTGQIATQQDYIVRNVQAQVGGNIQVNLANASEGQIVLNHLLANVSGIQNATVERILNPRLSGSNMYDSTLRVKTIDPDTWALSAHYEDGWFSGNNLQDALKALKADNNTIIVSRSFAKQFNYNLYDKVPVDFASCPRSLKIVGFFGPEPSDNSGGVRYYSGSSRSPVYISGPSYYYGSYNSPTDCYAPRDLFNVTDASSGIYQLENYETSILIKLQPGVDGTAVAQQIRHLDLDIRTVSSFDEEWQSSNQMNNVVTYSSLQTLDMQSFGLIFAVISASVGTALIAIVSLKERSREATLMSVRGLSYRQLVYMFITESLAIITFAVILGVIVGLIIVYGTVATANNSNIYSLTLVSQRIIFPAQAIATISTYAALIYASTIGAIIVMSYQYVTKLEKMVRSR